MMRIIRCDRTLAGIFYLVIVLGLTNSSELDEQKLRRANLKRNRRIQDEYIVTLSPDATDAEVSDHLNRTKGKFQDVDDVHVGDRKKNNKCGGRRRGPLMSVGTYKAYVITCFKEKDLELIISDNIVAKVEEQQIIRVDKSCTNVDTQSRGLWNLDRINQKSSVLDNIYNSSQGVGVNVNIYIVDSGIQKGHPEFGGRAEFGVNCLNSYDTPTDKDGHGTHVAGIAAGLTVGVARGATLIAVKVSENSEATTSSVTAGITWAANDAAERNKPAILNLSIGWPKEDHDLNQLIAQVVKKGLIVVVAAGNEASDACDYTPANVPDAITVASSTKYDELAASSNTGMCVDIIAPGEKVLCPDLHGYTIHSGTSFATPLVSGVIAANLNGSHNLGNPSPYVVANWLEEGMLDGVVDVKATGTANILLFGEPCYD
ncbi:unnamed protein product [Owenia fusiformis]|uniref:Peptidase S8/S53 domain-containing protein n=1 Tax=Owenia fusiformis TaxID=6347 RepID=A0A8J1XN70_OWEFU|nr:unnamed protein product [Owenia fusiformis]